MPLLGLVYEWRGHHQFPTSGVIQFAFVLSGTLVLAALSYMIVERPIIFWSTGRATPKLTDLKIETLHPIGSVPDPSRITIHIEGSRRDT